MRVFCFHHGPIRDACEYTSRLVYTNFTDCSNLILVSWFCVLFLFLSKFLILASGAGATHAHSRTQYTHTLSHTHTHTHRGDLGPLPAIYLIFKQMAGRPLGAINGDNWSLYSAVIPRFSGCDPGAILGNKQIKWLASALDW